MKTSIALTPAFTLLLLVLSFTAPGLADDDVPRGYLPLDELADAQEEAREKGKMVAVVAKGFDDQCPYCAAAFEVGTKGLRNDCVMVFTRVKDFRSQRESLPGPLKQKAGRVADGAAVTFLVLDPDLTTIVAETDRGRLQEDPRSIREVREKVDEARENWKNAPAKESSDTAAHAEETWTNTDGNSLRATFRSLDGDEVLFLDPAGREIRYPVAKLSKESRQRLAEIGGERKAEGN